MKACTLRFWTVERLLPFLTLLMLAFVGAGWSQTPNDGYIQVPGLIHLDSSISGGESTPEELAAAARSAGAGFAFLTDHDTQAVSYGIFPLRKLLRVRYSRDSVRSYGFENYLRDIDGINRGMSDFVLLPGIESVPYYSWDRDRDGVLRLRHLHRHLLVLGLDRPGDLEHLPSIEAGYPTGYTRNSLLALLWVAPLLLALFAITRPGARVEVDDERLHGKRRIPLIRFGAWGMLIASGLALAEAYPFREAGVNQYPPDLGAEPYQKLIDYVHARGGMTFWAHPEAAWNRRFGEPANPVARFLMERFAGGGIGLETEPYTHLLNDTHDYTGFAIFNEGAKTVGVPGGLWDDLLMQFCAGARDRPVWAVAEQDLESGVDPSAADETRTVLLVRSKTPKEYLHALRCGRMYCFTAHMDTKIKFREYAVLAGGGRAVSGEVVGWSPEARLLIELAIAELSPDLEVVVVRDGAVLDRRKAAGGELIDIPLLAAVWEMSYVRVMIYQGERMVAATNPIFFAGKGAQ